MEVIILKEPQQIAKKCADIFQETICQKHNAVLGLATGSTPILLYRELVDRYQKQLLSFENVVTFNLDEYVGLAPEHPQSYSYFMQQHLFKYINISSKNTHLPNGIAQNPIRESREYEEKIREYGIDLQLLGLGSNGHIGFNEPTSSLGSQTRIKTLAQQTIEDNSRFFSADEFQPTLAITMGIGTIMFAKRVVLLAIGEKKARAIQQAIEGPISAWCPASALQMHPHTTFIIDEEAAQFLQMKDYYHWVYKQQQQLLQKLHNEK
ncbi:glucosamine-6-phosphate deaminase [Candidatus Uabimicrobium amorphum]|uniref:Glucosamine-6-phosphate deaminase n=1 Tax=Uabimicrobium amorphum TaxID=2596890 RepID=A0A5S9F5N1_UABAM|nr:glucosamine-6-phosphate deaminase [Candidatus Uabimicrobium amorphum]BBM86798.1 putative glucosamine-6-phosphate deaminase 2 [Candidatus Uabimicrobium amorphum]